MSNSFTIGYEAEVPLPPPDGVELLQVQIFHRHGDRTPLRPGRLPGFEAESMDRCREKVPGSADIKEEYWCPETFKRLGGCPECFYGQLTDQGCRRLRSSGGRLREGYFERDGLLPTDRGPTASEVHFRSTDVPRTRDSIRCIIDGLWKGKARDLDVAVMAGRGKFEYMYPNAESCPKLEELQEQFKYDELMLKARQRPGLKQMFDVTENPNVIESDLAIFDTLAFKMAHGEKLPDGVTRQDVREVMNSVEARWITGYSHSREVLRLSIGKLVGDAADTIRSAIGRPPKYAGIPWDGEMSFCWGKTGEPYPKMVIYSGHDTTVGPLAAALGAPYPYWPPLGSILALELFRRKSDGRAQVRVMRNGEVTKSVAGIAADKDGLVDWDQLEKALEPFIPTDYWQECRSKAISQPGKANATVA